MENGVYLITGFPGFLSHKYRGRITQTGEGIQAYT